MRDGECLTKTGNYEVEKRNKIEEHPFGGRFKTRWNETIRRSSFLIEPLLSLEAACFEVRITIVLIQFRIERVTLFAGNPGTLARTAPIQCNFSWID